MTTDLLNKDSLEVGKFNHGRGDSAFLRRLARAERNSEIRGPIPGTDFVEMSCGRQYRVRKDGAFIRQAD
jgi:hypothetical protein